MSLVRVNNLSAGYGFVDVLRDISLDISAGEIVAVLGSNGVGKTTLNNTLSGLIKLKSGEIYFEDKLISNQSSEDIVDLGVIHVPEGRKLFPNLSVRDNLELGSYRRGKKNRAKNLDNVLDIFPKLSDRIDQIAGTLSGGEQQMCAIGRAIMSGPKLLLMDEPSAGLAPVVVQQVFGLVRRIREEGYTVLIVEQNVQQVLKVVDRAYLLEAGQLIDSGKSSDLLESETVRKAYMGL